jgi:uncharacterized membrane protein
MKTAFNLVHLLLTLILVFYATISFTMRRTYFRALWDDAANADNRAYYQAIEAADRFTRDLYVPLLLIALGAIVLSIIMLYSRFFGRKTPASPRH